MKSTIDAAGRVVIPKDLRKAAGLEPGTAVEITFHDGKIEIETAPAEVMVHRKGRFFVASPMTEPDQPLTDDDVQEVRRRIRKDRD